MKNPNDLKVTSGDAPEQETGPVNAMQEKLDQKPAELHQALNENDEELSETINAIKKSGKQVFIVYRDNSIYKELGSGVARKFQDNDISVTLQAFPVGTDPTIIKERIESNLSVDRNGIYISDRTCGIDRDRYKNSINTDLDRICDNLAQKAYIDYGTNKDTFDLMGGESDILPTLSLALNNALSSVEQKPKRISINRRNILDHLSLSTVKNIMPEINLNPDLSEDRKDIGYRPMIVGGNTIQFTKLLANKLKDMLNFEGEVVVDDNKKGDWHISDRHNRAKSGPNANVFQLPMMNMMEDMAEYGLLNKNSLPTKSAIERAILLETKGGLPKEQKL